MLPKIHSVTIPVRNESALPALLDAHSFTYYQWPNVSPTTVFCVHGLTRTGRDFDFLAQALASHFNVICPDMSGRGKSQWLTDSTGYNYATYIADILYIVDALKLSALHWVGTSMGGIIALMLAAQRPGLIKSLVLNDIGCLIPASGLERILSYAGIRMEFANRAEAEQELRSICMPFGITQEIHWQHLFEHSLRLTPNGTWAMHYDPAIMSGFDKTEIKDINLWPFWPAIQPIPVLLIRGQRSDILLHETALAMKAQHKNLTLYEVENAGHAPALMAAEQIEVIRNWLSR